MFLKSEYKNQIKLGNFREDLYRRLNVFQIDIEPLVKRTSDIPLLIEYFSNKISEIYNLKKLSVDLNNKYLLNYSCQQCKRIKKLNREDCNITPSNQEKISSIVRVLKRAK